jgi:hypothetical protein
MRVGQESEHRAFHFKTGTINVRNFLRRITLDRCFEPSLQKGTIPERSALQGNCRDNAAQKQNCRLHD